MVYFRDLPKYEKLELYKQIKAWYLFEGSWSVNRMKNIMDEKAKDIKAVLLYDSPVAKGCLIRVYKCLTHGAFC